jgi:hypothetical protein
VITVDELRRMSPDERAELSRALAALDDPAPPAEADLPAGPRRRAIALIAIIGCCAALAAWTGVLAATLPRYYHTGGWRGAWVGFDLALLITFALTAWAGWRHRQLVIICLVVLATLLCCDAWFDVTLDLRTSGFLVSLLMALCIELPLAALAVIGARRLMRLNIRALGRFRGLPRPVPPLWQVPLYGLESRGFRNLIPVEPCYPTPQSALAGLAEGTTARGQDLTTGAPQQGPAGPAHEQLQANPRATPG